MLVYNKYQQLNWSKNNGLIPAIIQHVISGEILMLGYMNKEAIINTENTGYVTFFSRSKNRLWVKGEKSGNKLKLNHWYPDCDYDSLLILALPQGPTCHKNTSSCFYPAVTKFNFLYKLENIISSKKNSHSSSHKSSYTFNLYTSGTNRIAQKVGEEGVETAIAAVSQDSNSLINEASDLIYHLLVLLQHKSINFAQVIHELQNRNNYINKSIQKNS